MKRNQRYVQHAAVIAMMAALPQGANAATLTFDIGMSMMRAFEGPLPAFASDVLGGELDILGTRIR